MSHPESCGRVKIPKFFVDCRNQDVDFNMSSQQVFVEQAV